MTTRPRSVAPRYYNEESSGGGDTLAGDVTGPLLTNTVVALQNKPIPSGAIGFGNVLISNGTQWTLGTPTSPTNQFSTSSGAVTIATGSVNIDTANSSCRSQHLRIEQTTRGAISTIGFSLQVLASGAFEAVFPALYSVQLGSLEAFSVIAANTGASPTAACTSILVGCDFPAGSIRLRGTTGAGLTLGPYAGSITIAYRY